MARKLLTALFTLTIALFSLSQELCENGIDDDNDGLIDLYDREDCPCSRVSSPALISVLPNPSFEDVDSLPQGWSQLNYAKFWRTAGLGTSDLLSTNSFMHPYTSLPLPDGDNCAGIFINKEYGEYLGVCLFEPLVAGEPYVLTFKVACHTYIDVGCPPVLPPIDLTLYGINDCPAFPLNTLDCPEPFGWTAIGAVSYVPRSSWETVTMTFKPETDVHAIIVGGPCDVPDAYAVICVSAYFAIDDLELGYALEEAVYYVPNSFTPNDDEFNQVFHPEFVCGFDLEEYQFEVYNRWGEVIFQSFDAATGWDGTYKGVLMQPGVYPWRIIYKNSANDGRELVSGHVNLLR